MTKKVEEELKYWRETWEYKILYSFMKAHAKDNIVLMQADRIWKIKYFNNNMIEIERIHRLDKVSYKNIRKIIQFVNNEDFWNRTIHSFSYFRKLNRDKVKYIHMFVSKLGLEIETSEKKLTMDKPVEWERVNHFEKPETEILIMKAQEKFGITKKVWSNLDKNFWTDKKEALKLKQKEND